MSDGVGGTKDVHMTCDWCSAPGVGYHEANWLCAECKESAEQEPDEEDDDGFLRF